MIKISATLAKKVPIEGLAYSSQQYGAAMEIEISDADRPDAIKSRIQELYALLAQTIDEQIGAAQPSLQQVNAGTVNSLPQQRRLNSPAPAATQPQNGNGRRAPYSDVVEVMTDRARLRGLVIRSERYAVMPGALYPTPGTKIELPGARLFGSLDFEPVKGVPFPSGCTPSAGIRNSHDKSFALSILSGARVFICANGVLSAEHVISRKHTSGLDMVESIDKALDAFMDSIRAFQETYTKLNAWRLTKTRAHSLIVDLARGGAFSSSDILPVVQEFENPRHPEFKEPTAWNLYQSATEIMKAQSPARQVEGFKSLNTVLTAHLN